MSNEKTIINQEANKLQQPFEKLAAVNVCVFVFILKRQELERGCCCYFLSLPSIPFHSIVSFLFSFIFVHFIM